MLEVDSVLYAQCVYCHEWEPVQYMQWDEEKQAYACDRCFDSVPLF